MSIKSDVDKAKVRTAIKIFLTLKGDASARQLAFFINDLNLKLRSNINSTVIANELTYCMSETKNFLQVNFYKDNKGIRRYYLENKKD